MHKLFLSRTHLCVAEFKKIVKNQYNKTIKHGWEICNKLLEKNKLIKHKKIKLKRRVHVINNKNNLHFKIKQIKIRVYKNLRLVNFIKHILVSAKT